MHRLFMVVLAAGLLVGAAVASAQPATPLPPLNGVMMCESAGGTVVTRYPQIVTSGGMALGALGQPFCEFTADDGSRISAPLDVLAANGPTLAVVAYTYPPAFVPDGTTVNPSYTYCAQLGGARMLDWVRADDPTDAVNFCVFGDGSIADAFGVFYKSDGTIRGADLTPLFGWTAGAEYRGAVWGIAKTRLEDLRNLRRGARESAPAP